MQGFFLFLSGFKQRLKCDTKWTSTTVFEIRWAGGKDSLVTHVSCVLTGPARARLEHRTPRQVGLPGSRKSGLLEGGSQVEGQRGWKSGTETGGSEFQDSQTRDGVGRV